MIQYTLSMYISTCWVKRRSSSCSLTSGRETIGDGFYSSSDDSFSQMKQALLDCRVAKAVERARSSAKQNFPHEVAPYQEATVMF